MARATSWTRPESRRLILNKAAEGYSLKAIEAAAEGDQATVHQWNIQLLQEHRRHYPATEAGKRKDDRALRTIANLRAQLSELQETTP